MPRELRNLRMFVLVSSKNENNNGFDLVGLNSFSFDYRRVVYFSFRCRISLFSLVAFFRFDEMLAY